MLIDNDLCDENLTNVKLDGAKLSDAIYLKMNK